MIDTMKSITQFDEIAELAEIVAEEHCPDSPIDPQNICDIKRITTSYGNYGDAFEGILEYRNGKFHIFCNIGKLVLSTRLRFTLAHELGHFYISEHRHALMNGISYHHSFAEYQSDNIAEKQADQFASNLLMPPKRTRKAIVGVDRGFASIMRISRQFNTSLTSSASCYVSLDDVPCALIKWNPNKTASWYRFSDSAYRNGFRKINAISSSVPVDSPTGSVFSGDISTTSKYNEGITIASQWFPFIRQGAKRDIFFIEQAIGLGEFGYLTLVFPRDKDEIINDRFSW